MIEMFNKMMFEMDEALHFGIIVYGKSIPLSIYIMSTLFSGVIMIGFIVIVLHSKWYEEHEDLISDKFTDLSLPIIVFIFVLLELYYEEYDQILFFLFFVDIILIIGIRKEFKGFREWLDEKFGWLF